MLRKIAIFAAACVFSANAYPNGQFNSWQAAGASDHRAPCPGLNTLANHGYLNHNGQGITKTQMHNALTSVYNLEASFADFLIDQGFALATTDSHGNQVLDLQSLRAHNVIEHDASLTRFDIGDKGDNWTAQRALIDQLKSLSSDGKTLGWKEFAKARRLREKQEAASDSSYSLPLKQGAGALLEAAVAIRVFGNGDSIPLSTVESFFANEKIPDGWSSPATPYTAGQAAGDTAKLKALMLIG